MGNLCRRARVVLSRHTHLTVRASYLCGVLALTYLIYLAVCGHPSSSSPPLFLPQHTPSSSPLPPSSSPPAHTPSPSPPAHTPSPPAQTPSPPSFLPGLASPCWYTNFSRHHYRSPSGYFDPTSSPLAANLHIEKEWRALVKSLSLLRHLNDSLLLTCTPAIYIVGAPKCATTDLFQRLTVHPLISGVVGKETQWWSHLRFGLDPENKPWPIQRNAPFREYLDVLLPNSMDVGKSPSTRIIEGSTHYLASARCGVDGSLRTTAADIAQFSPAAKIIIAVRDPVDRALSSYVFLNTYLHLPTTPDHFHQTISRAVGNLKRCLNLEHTSDTVPRFDSLPYPVIRRCAYTLSTRYPNDTVANTHLTYGFYSIFYRDWMSAFEPEQVFLVNSEEMKTEAGRQRKLEEILEFLGLSANKNVNELMVRKKKKNVNTYIAVGGRFDMLPETRTLLRSVYRWFNKDLAKLSKDGNYLKWNRNK